MQETTQWWKNGVIYQIYPKSFQDSTGSGTGDIQGIISRLDYLKELGVAGIWITPMYVSPQYDNGYDIADYFNIDPSYGTMEDFECLTAEAHKRDIKVIMDMVLNHTSTEHQWFQQGQDPNNEYHDYYIWKEGTPEALPNNWQSKFGGTAWKWSDKAGKYYLHLFATEQADLNWENPKVRQQAAEICQFWAKKGVDGLRLDVINLISKNQDFPNDDKGDGRRFYTDGPRIHEFLQELSLRSFKPNNLMTVGEMSSTSLENCQQYAALDGRELSMTFNFHHLKVDYPNGDKWTYASPDFVELKSIFNYWQQGMHGKAWNALFWCNHDQPRIVSRFGDNSPTAAKLWAMVLHGMQGTPYIYQGEEIGMTNPDFDSIEHYRDVESLNMYKILQAKGKNTTEILNILAQKSRDNSRTPMQWNSLPNAGFSNAQPWINVASNYHKINVENALKDKNSVFYLYQTLIKLRKQYAIFTDGDYYDLAPKTDCTWQYIRSKDNEQLLVLANLSGEEQKVTLTSELLSHSWEILLNNDQHTVELQEVLYLKPYQAVYFYHN
ncbi:alpha,alpha-phosphotrehalase [Conservatibacter flavescens]|uniref:Alpha,alpha-phosphotrehalase n=1 Tax=Conservatibacter flavescens TaxID=28161 RepID=A0A2M8S543_9PAST|nr:alpha,alpha-phosphotrehalase [Conservatibacter flavescens]PJG86251.1 alpha,alpha-phosphotrehalase [Conservatibacter flavescens]